MSKTEDKSKTPPTQDERLSEGDHNGKGITNDRYSASESSQPQLSPKYDVRADEDGKAKSTDDRKSSAESPNNKSGDPEAHAKSAQKSKVTSN